MNVPGLARESCTCSGLSVQGCGPRRPAAGGTHTGNTGSPSPAGSRPRLLRHQGLTCSDRSADSGTRHGAGQVLPEVKAHTRPLRLGDTRPGTQAVRAGLSLRISTRPGRWPWAAAGDVGTLPGPSWAETQGPRARAPPRTPGCRSVPAPRGHRPLRPRGLTDPGAIFLPGSLPARRLTGGFWLVGAGHVGQGSCKGLRESGVASTLGVSTWEGSAGRRAGPFPSARASPGARARGRDLWAPLCAHHAWSPPRPSAPARPHLRFWNFLPTAPCRPSSRAAPRREAPARPLLAPAPPPLPDTTPGPER